MKHRHLIIAAIFTALTCPLAAAKDDGGPKTFYRYRDANGIQVINYTIPPELIPNGYDIVTASGRVVETVPPKSEEPGEETETKAQEPDPERQREDDYILRSYSTVNEIKEAKARRLRLLDRELEIVQSNIAEYGRRQSDLRERAARHQAAGEPVPKAVAEVLNDLIAQKKSALAVLKERRVERKALSDKYDFYARRLVELKGDSALSTKPQTGPDATKPIQTATPASSSE